MSGKRINHQSAGLFLLAAVAMLIHPSLAAAQWLVPLYTFDGVALADRFGSAVAGAGDVNDDGLADLIVGAREADPNGEKNGGTATVFSGADGSVLYVIEGDEDDDGKFSTSDGDLLGYSVGSAGDIDGDGYDDFLVGSFLNGVNDHGSILGYSGVDGSLLFQIDGNANEAQFGEAVAGVGDIDGDNVPDIMFGATEEASSPVSFPGSVRVVSGANPNGPALVTLHGGATGDAFGDAVANAGDVDKDGVNDLLIGARLTDPVAGQNTNGTAFVYSGDNTYLLFSESGGNGEKLGASVDSVGDLDGDGHADFIVGLPGSDIVASNAGRAIVYSGKTGNVLWDLVGDGSTDAFGSSVAGLGDVTGDGIGDFAIGAPFEDTNGNNSGAVYLYSGADGGLLETYFGDGVGDTFGRHLAAAGDVNGDGFGDLIVGAEEFQFNSFGNGYARVYVTTIPEPTTLGLFGVATIALLRRRQV